MPRAYLAIPSCPERWVQKVGAGGRRQFDAEQLRRGLAIVLVAVVLKHMMLLEKHGILSVLQGKNSTVTALQENALKTASSLANR